MNTKQTNRVSIDHRNVILHFGDMEPVVIPRKAVRTRLRLIELVYRLSGWPGMKMRYLREFIAGIHNYHGWTLPDSEEDPLLTSIFQCGSDVKNEDRVAVSAG